MVDECGLNARRSTTMHSMRLTVLHRCCFALLVSGAPWDIAWVCGCGGGCLQNAQLSHIGHVVFQRLLTL